MYKRGARIFAYAMDFVYSMPPLLRMSIVGKRGVLTHGWMLNVESSGIAQVPLDSVHSMGASPPWQHLPLLACEARTLRLRLGVYWV